MEVENAKSPSLLTISCSKKEFKEETENPEGSVSKGDICTPNEPLPSASKTPDESHFDMPSTISPNILITSNESHGKEADRTFSSEKASSTDVPTSPVNLKATPAAASKIPLNNSASVEAAITSAVVGTSDEQTSAEGQTESSDEHSGGSTNRECGFWGHFRNSMISLRESKILLPFEFLLLSLPLSSGFMGARYMEKCPVSPAIPLLLFMMGILGTVVICSRIYAVFKKALFPNSDWLGQVRSVIISGLLMMSILYATELACFFIAAPSFQQGSFSYCHETFYSFVYYINYISIALVIFLLILHCPGSHPCSFDMVPLVFEP